jgi:hypothetical protein
MANLQKHWGTFIPGEVTLKGSFRTNVTDPPDAIRDGNTNVIESVERDSAGLFTVTLADNIQVPELPITMKAWVNPPDASFTLVCDAVVLEDSWSQADKSFQIQVRMVGDTGASAYFDPAAADPDDLSRVCFEICGSFMGIGTDEE